MDLAGVDTELAGQFANRAIALKRRQGYLRLKRRAVLLPRLLHDCSSFWAVYRSRTLASPPVSDPGSITVWSGRRGPCHRIPPENRTAPDSLSARTTRPLPILVLRYAAERFIVAPPVVGWMAGRVVTSPSLTLWTRAHSAS